MAKNNKPEGYTFGRPTKYKRELIDQTYDYIERTDIPFIEELAVRELRVDEDTIVEWGKRYKDFSVAIKRLKTKQKLALLKASLGKQFNVGGAIFQLKANHGLSEGQKNIDFTSGGKPLEPNVTVSNFIKLSESLEDADDEKLLSAAQEQNQS